MGQEVGLESWQYTVMPAVCGIDLAEAIYGGCLEHLTQVLQKGPIGWFTNCSKDILNAVAVQLPWDSSFVIFLCF